MSLPFNNQEAGTQMEEMMDDVAFAVVRDLNDKKTLHLQYRIEAALWGAHVVDKATRYVTAILSVAYWIFVTGVQFSLRTTFEVFGVISTVYVVMCLIASRMIGTAEATVETLRYRTDRNKLIMVPIMIVTLWQELPPTAVGNDPEPSLRQVIMHPFARLSIVKLIDDYWELRRRSTMDDPAWDAFYDRARADLPQCKRMILM